MFLSGGGQISSKLVHISVSLFACSHGYSLSLSLFLSFSLPLPLSPSLFSAKRPPSHVEAEECVVVACPPFCLEL